MKLITVPPDVLFQISGKDQRWSLKFFVVNVLSEDQRWFSDAAWEEAFDSVCSAFEPAEVGARVKLTDEHHEKLVKVTREMQFNGSVKPSIRSLVRALTQAPTVKEERVEGSE